MCIANRKNENGANFSAREKLPGFLAISPESFRKNRQEKNTISEPVTEFPLKNNLSPKAEKINMTISSHQPIESAKLNGEKSFSAQKYPSVKKRSADLADEKAEGAISEIKRKMHKIKELFGNFL